jgi:hypothetical protein
MSHRVGERFQRSHCGLLVAGGTEAVHGVQQQTREIDEQWMLVVGAFKLFEKKM